VPLKFTSPAGPVYVCIRTSEFARSIPDCPPSPPTDSNQLLLSFFRPLKAHVPLSCVPPHHVVERVLHVDRHALELQRAEPVVEARDSRRNDREPRLAVDELDRIQTARVAVCRAIGEAARSCVRTPTVRTEKRDDPARQARRRSRADRDASRAAAFACRSSYR